MVVDDSTPNTVNGQSTPQVRDHDRFNQGDLILISSDQVRFRVDSSRFIYTTLMPSTAENLAASGERKLFETSIVVQRFLEIYHDGKFTNASDGIDPEVAGRVVQFIKRYDFLPFDTITVIHLALVAACVAENIKNVAILLDEAASKVPTWERHNLSVMSQGISDYDIRGFAHRWLALIPSHFLAAILRATHDGGSSTTPNHPGDRFREIMKDYQVE